MVGSDLGNAPSSWSTLMGQTNGRRGQHWDVVGDGDAVGRLRRRKSGCVQEIHKINIHTLEHNLPILTISNFI